jgi:hypothetical protein
MKRISSLAGQKVGPELLALWEVCEVIAQLYSEVK